MQDQDRPQSAEVTVDDESDIADDRDSAKWQHALRAERGEYKAGSKISNECGESHRAISFIRYRANAVGLLTSVRKRAQNLRRMLVLFRATRSYVRF